MLLSRRSIFRWWKKWNDRQDVIRKRKNQIRVIANGFMDFLAVSRSKVHFSFLSLFLFFFPFMERIRFFSLTCCRFIRIPVFHGFSMHLPDAPAAAIVLAIVIRLAVPSKSYHTLSRISINATALIARSSPYYRRATLRPCSYAALAEFIASTNPVCPSLKVLEEEEEEEARTPEKPKSMIPIMWTIYRSWDMPVISIFQSINDAIALSIYLSFESVILPTNRSEIFQVTNAYLFQQRA